MEKIPIKSRLSGEVIFEAEAAGFKEVVEVAVRSKVDLSSADLSGAKLSGAKLSGAKLIRSDIRYSDLSYADLSYSDLSSADLSCTYLRDVDLSSAKLSFAYLSGAYLSGAKLSGANLGGANLGCANLICADLSGADLSRTYLRGVYLMDAKLGCAKLNWKSNDLISAILLKEAGDNIERIKASGLVICLSDWCWSDFLNLSSEPEFSWAMGVLVGYVIEEGWAPKELVDWKNGSSAASGEGGVS